jgi:hypothetical protein
MTTEAAQAYIEAIPPERRRCWRNWPAYVDKITAGTRELLVAEGLEKQQHDRRRGTARTSTTCRCSRTRPRARAPPHPQGHRLQRARAGQQARHRLHEGGHNVLAHVLMQREAAITRAEKNRVGLSLYGLALSHPNRDFWTTIKPVH